MLTQFNLANNRFQIISIPTLTFTLMKTYTNLVIWGLSLFRCKLMAPKILFYSCSLFSQKLYNEAKYSHVSFSLPNLPLHSTFLFLHSHLSRQSHLYFLPFLPPKTFSRSCFWIFSLNILYVFSFTAHFTKLVAFLYSFLV